MTTLPRRTVLATGATGPRVTVRWQVARDAAFDVVRSGTFTTGPSRDHTVKVDVTVLRLAQPPPVSPIL